jgi:hypothetical protein
VSPGSVRLLIHIAGSALPVAIGGFVPLVGSVVSVIIPEFVPPATPASSESASAASEHLGPSMLGQDQAG